MKNPLTPAGIEPATFRFVAQHLNRCATAVPTYVLLAILLYSRRKRRDPSTSFPTCPVAVGNDDIQKARRLE